MCLVFVCDEDERVIGRHEAPGAVQAVDVETQWRLCFVPLYFKSKRRHICSICGRRLVVRY
ncbi:PREDICTED: uncharacterized protein LOC109116734 [Tarenaya hassleriana]|uniref:uncharacterized protein LOC109116734 n=1 Tax=Tarenaya hassleriana TaxID=28532 RepID=UPI0008FD6BB1|nr:PREDICTED: uncharacterized protein LOC109116734 [Tarenaya hassleriana]